MSSLSITPETLKHSFGFIRSGVEQGLVSELTLLKVGGTG